MESIPLEEIICESNRKYTKENDFDQLLNSIMTYGIIQAPVVRRMEDGQFKVIAGRRRIEAARVLKFTSVNCEVREANDPVDDEEIALTENVNRQDMHPLDEAGAFRRMADNGNSVEEIARYYARSPAAIYKRLRLCGLIEELKRMFRDGLLNIASAAVLAELPEDDQKDFYELYGKNDKENEIKEIEHGKIYQFVNKKQRYVIKKCMQGCEECKKRTHNEDNELFVEFENMSDVCLDAECYRKKWLEMLEVKLGEQEIQFKEAEVQTDSKIYFTGGVLELLYKKAAYVNIKDNYGLQIKYEVLRDKDYIFSGETGRKKDACWSVNVDYNGAINVRRFGYKAKPPKEEKAKSESGGTSGKSSVGVVKKEDIKNYGTEAIEAVAADRGMAPTELVKQLKEKKIFAYEFQNDIDDDIKERVIARKIEAAKKRSHPAGDYLSVFLRLLNEHVYGCDFIETHFNVWQKQWLEDLIGCSLSKLSERLSDEVQQLFHFLILSIGFDDVEVPLPEISKEDKEQNIFWHYAAMSEEEYRAMYIEAAKEVASDALDPKKKKNGKKAAALHGDDGE